MSDPRIEAITTVIEVVRGSGVALPLNQFHWLSGQSDPAKAAADFLLALFNIDRRGADGPGPQAVYQLLGHLGYDRAEGLIRTAVRNAQGKPLTTGIFEMPPFASWYVAGITGAQLTHVLITCDELERVVTPGLQARLPVEWNWRWLFSPPASGKPWYQATSGRGFTTLADLLRCIFGADPGFRELFWLAVGGGAGRDALRDTAMRTASRWYRECSKAAVLNDAWVDSLPAEAVLGLTPRHRVISAHDQPHGFLQLFFRWFMGEEIEAIVAELRAAITPPPAPDRGEDDGIEEIAPDAIEEPDETT